MSSLKAYATASVRVSLLGQRRADGRVMNDLDGIAVWVAHIEGPSPVSMRLRPRLQRDALRNQITSPSIDIVGPTDKKS